MCGINLFIDKKNNSDETIIRKMNAATQHRGPDASRFGKYQYQQNNVYIGNNRLKIMDISDNANQPFISADGRYCLSFNGEIYNYQELRASLYQKYTFNTNSDSEVLLYQLIEHGKNGIAALNGMFAFVFYDAHTGVTLIARDRHGIKPVYYYTDQSFTLVSSEIKGLLATGLIVKELNHKQIPYYLHYKYAQKPETFYKNIFELEPGHILQINFTSFKIEKWVQDIIESKIIKNNTQIIQETKELLFKAVEQQLQSDVSNGIFLSGGIDSTLLLAIANETGIKNLPSFSIVNSKEDKNFGTDDFLYARKAAKLYNSAYEEIVLDSEILKYSDKLFKEMDQPIGDSALLLTWILSKKASSNIRVALSGAGADEWFAGYNRHWAYQKYLSHFYRNNFLLTVSKSLSKLIPDGFSHPLRKEARLWNKFSTNISSDPIETYDRFRSVHLPQKMDFNRGINKIESIFTAEKLLSNALLKDRSEYLVSDVLMLTDKMSMLAGLEVRVPYLDNDLTNYLSTVPSELLLKHGKKWILKEHLRNMRGAEFTERKKEGFGMPIGKWIKEEKNYFLLEAVKNKNNYVYNYIPYEDIQNLLSDHLSGKNDYSSAIWSLIVLTNWIQYEFS
ncbi:MAG TPA: asparagine synthase (glutamine-hydrolyzing) [Cytophagaceae bacterium]|jgi:asparagine synthase (glutamine-hydrolysing)|nr:asparagine synthase (glutamine-hydrolyzing) [Cytophagaceae bacterium]